MAQLSRRDLMLRASALGCSIAASPLVTPISFADAPWDNRLVVIVLRGGMDGLDVVRPVGDPSFAALRPDARDGLPLDGYFELHPALAPVLPLWEAGELAFVHATSTPYRDHRSHFDGQDHLEAGFATPELGQVRDGWLNRLLQTQTGLRGDVAFSVGHGETLLLRGAAPVSNWTPEVDLMMSGPTLLLAERIMQNDPLFQATFEEAVQIAGSDGDAVMHGMAGAADVTDMEMMNPAPKGTSADKAKAQFVAQRLTADTRIASFSMNGWDSHRGQEALLSRSLARLADVLNVLRADLGPVWAKTTVLALTEFGRTVRLNGSRGTDHGTGGLMLLAGGTLAKSQVLGRWPGLSEADLYQRRDLLPTSDVRAHAAWAIRHSFGLDRDLLEQTVFPNLDLSHDLGLFA
ncbi:DUF1501 domain-containing protein [Primorskyibacter sp. S187A]|uniref:DUF1501 domain-containing protein n=1 Tax=Primorskyibacter sp. S187A TaxID=3415130 RepID=UPI003C7DB0B5